MAEEQKYQDSDMQTEFDINDIRIGFNDGHTDPLEQELLDAYEEGTRDAEAEMEYHRLALEYIKYCNEVYPKDKKIQAAIKDYIVKHVFKKGVL